MSARINRNGQQLNYVVKDGHLMVTLSGRFETWTANTPLSELPKLAPKKLEKAVNGLDSYVWTATSRQWLSRLAGSTDDDEEEDSEYNSYELMVAHGYDTTDKFHMVLYTQKFHNLQRARVQEQEQDELNDTIECLRQEVDDLRDVVASLVERIKALESAGTA